MHSLWNRLPPIVLAAFLGVAAGCAADPAPKKTAATDPPAKKATAEDPLSQQARQMRASTSGESGTGLSDKSREIERDLGYQ